MSTDNTKDNPDTPEDERASSLRPDDLVAQLVPDPSDVQSLIVLSGFLGRSAHSDYWRLYSTAAMNEYIDIAESEIVHSVQSAAGSRPLSRTILWLSPSAQVKYCRTSARTVQAEFLRGPITQRSAAPTGFPRASSRIVPNVRYNSEDICLSDFCSADVPRYCPTHWGCGPDTNLDCGWTDDFGVCNP
jgi:hypothetical protein